MTSFVYTRFTGVVWDDSAPTSDLTLTGSTLTLSVLNCGTGIEAEVKGVTVADVEGAGDWLIMDRDGSSTQSMPSCLCHSTSISGDTLNLSAVSIKELLRDASRTKDLKSSV